MGHSHTELIVEWYYHPDRNLFYDHYNQLILDYFPTITPGQLTIFRHNKRNMKVYSQSTGLTILLLYPDGKPGYWHFTSKDYDNLISKQRGLQSKIVVHDEYHILKGAHTHE